MRLTFHHGLWKLIFDEYQEMHLRMEWDLFHCDLEVKSFHMNSSLIFQVLVAFSLSVHVFEVVQHMFTKFDSLSNYESHRDWISSSWLIHMHTQDFRKISQLVIFKLSSCDLSPPLKPTVGGSSKVHKMSYTHPNLIPSVAMGSRRQYKEMKKYPFWYFQVDRLWLFNF